jgi:hypothetical protein
MFNRNRLQDDDDVTVPLLSILARMEKMKKTLPDCRILRSCTSNLKGSVCTFALVLKAAMIAAVLVVAASGALALVDTEGHGVCAGTGCPLQPCPRVIEPCLAPVFPDLVKNGTDMAIALSGIIAALSVAFAAYRSYLKRKDFYVIR